MKQLVLITERLTAVNEIGGYVVGREHGQSAEFLNLGEIAIDGIDHEQVGSAVNGINLLQFRVDSSVTRWKIRQKKYYKGERPHSGPINIH